MSRLALQSIHLKNFKAIRDSGVVTFTPLTVFIGNNGSGKSSLIESLQTYQIMIDSGLDTAINRWRGFEYIRNQAVPRQQQRDPDELPSDETEENLSANEPEIEGRDKELNPIEITLASETTEGLLKTATTINASRSGNELFIQSEHLKLNDDVLLQRDENGDVERPLKTKLVTHLENGESIITSYRAGDPYAELLARQVSRWQYMLLNPEAMGLPMSYKRTGGVVRLAPNGANLAEYLRYIQAKDDTILFDIIDTLRYVLPYAEDLQLPETSELERTVYLSLTERDFKVPGWLLSTGTLRILALLAVLKNPEPPPLIIIEEIENGLDPRTINLIVDEMRSITESGTSQIILTTHSPYLLDLLDLEQIVVVERTDGQPTFFRPSTDEALQKWAESFTPGRLYTMSQLTRRSAE